MKSTKNYKLDPSTLCKKLQTTTINSTIDDIKVPTPKEISNANNSSKKKKKSHQGSSHWSTYKFDPSDKLGRLRRIRANTSIQDLRNLIINTKNNILPPCFKNTQVINYCLLCGSPGHTIDQCNPNHEYTKYLKDGKEDGRNTIKRILEGSRQWSIESVNTHSILPLSTSNVDLNNNISFKKSSKYKNQYDTSLHQVALPIVENDLTNNCKIIEDKVERKKKELNWTKVEKNEWELRSSPKQQLLKNIGFKATKLLSSNKKKLDNGISKTNARQGAQMQFRIYNYHKSNNVEVVEENNGCKIDNLLSSNLNNVYTSNSDESSLAIIFGTINGIETNMLLDTGSSISAVTETFAKQLKLKTWLTRDTLVVTLANTHIERYPEKTCLVTLKIGDLETFEELNVLPNQIYNITLGKSWLKKHKVICDYGRDLLQLPHSRPIQIGFPYKQELLPKLDVKSNKNNSIKSCQRTLCKFLRF